jgi:hypothetical protein
MVKRSRLSRKVVREQNPYVYFPEFTKQSIDKAIARDISEHGRVDSITLTYYLRPKKYGGLGMGVPKRRGKR